MAFALENERQKSTVAVAVVFCVLPTVSYGLRLLSRRIQKVVLNSSDYCALGALVCCWAICGLAIVNITHGGVGLHAKEVPLSAVKVFMASLFSIELLWAIAEGLIKTSMCLLYLGIFPMRSFHISVYIAIGICNAFALMVILSTTFICLPVKMSFDPTVQGHCGNRNALWLIIGVFNILTDLLVVILPIPVVWGLQLPQKKRFALVGIFSLGLFVCIVSMVRLQYLMKVDFTGDITYTVVNAVIWSLLEPTLAVTVGCMPTFGPLIRGYIKSWGKGSSSNNLNPSDLYQGKATGRFHRLSVENSTEIPLHSSVASPGTSMPSGKDSLDDLAEPRSLRLGENKIKVQTDWDVTSS